MQRLVEDAPDALLAGAQGPEVLGRLGHSLAIKAHDDAASRLSIDANVKKDLVGDLGVGGKSSA